MAELPQDLPVVERDVVRLVVRDGENRILLFHTRDITAPELGMVMPAGGIEEGETCSQTAVRELCEETGSTVMEWQSIIDRPDPPDIWTVIHEAAVKQSVRDVETTREQLTSLIEFAKRPNVFIQVLPCAAAEVAGETGPFHGLHISPANQASHSPKGAAHTMLPPSG